MYLTIKETAEYLSMSEAQVERLIMQGKIRALHDGGDYLIYKEQFNAHLREVEKAKKRLEEEPLPEDWDVKDED
ncbi:MAG TPA: excisionase family DNA-binding protein [Bacillales bacterium]|nr:excisionase family DNA-binding protein [Bacillales bacterium]